MKGLYNSVEWSYIKQFFKANIRTLYFFPKSIWYSLRLNQGEKFMLYNLNNYPYSYNNDSYNHKRQPEPVNVAQNLINNINEYEVLNVLVNDPKGNKWFRMGMPENKAKCLESANNSYTELVTILNQTVQKSTDFPVFVYSSIMQGHAFNQKVKFSPDVKVDNPDALIGGFVNKIQYASAEGVVSALEFLVSNNNYDQGVWDVIAGSLKNKEFQPEFTHVTNKTPFLFRYVEVSDKERGSSTLTEELNFFYNLGTL